MKNALTFNHLGQDFLLLPEKALYVASSEALIISDLHLGKINHFRKSGIPVPVKAQESNLENLAALIMQIKPESVFFLGDLFHSHYNSAWESFGQLISSFSEVQFHLITGNHDILSDHQYARYRIEMHGMFMLTDRIRLIHAPDEEKEDGLIDLCGHIHPAVMLRGKGLRAEKFPCFWFNEKNIVLPAFGAFTGTHCIAPKKSDRIFFIADRKVIDARSLNDPS